MCYVQLLWTTILSMSCISITHSINMYKCIVLPGYFFFTLSLWWRRTNTHITHTAVLLCTGAVIVWKDPPTSLTVYSKNCRAQPVTQLLRLMWRLNRNAKNTAVLTLRAVLIQPQQHKFLHWKLLIRSSGSKWDIYQTPSSGYHEVWLSAEASLWQRDVITESRKDAASFPCPLMTPAEKVTGTNRSGGEKVLMVSRLCMCLCWGSTLTWMFQCPCYTHSLSKKSPTDSL